MNSRTKIIMHHFASYRPLRRLGYWFILASMLAVLAACRVPTPQEVGTVPGGSVPEGTLPPTPAPAVASIVTPLPPDQAAPPVRLRMPALGLDAVVEPMGWGIVVADGKETTQWIVPEDALGWQVNSAGAGGQGNLIITGRQTAGAALLAPLALGEVKPGQEILVTDDEGVTFRYVVTEVSDPIPLVGANDDERAQEAAYAALNGDARLTLLTGWPDFTTTHRIFAVAEFAGLAE